MSRRFLNLIVDVPALADRQFTYELPYLPFLPQGAKVRVPFGRGEIDAFVVGEAEEPAGIAVKEVKYVYDLGFLPEKNESMLAFALSEYYCSPLSTALACFWPPVIPRRKIDKVVLPAQPSEAPKTAEQFVSNTPSVEGATLSARPGNRALARGSREFRWKIYLKRIRIAMETGLSIIVLVPEVKAITKARSLLEAEFPSEVAVLHSEQTGVARRDAYLRLRKREKRIALGTRSAVFAPVPNIGLIVIDEESSEAYKASESPFYDSRKVAGLRCDMEGCDILMGSSHPSVDAMHEALLDKMSTIMEESHKAEDAVTVVDLKDLPKGGMVLSSQLIRVLNDTFEDRGRAILFLNRRGDAGTVTCKDCGYTLKCDRCNSPLAYHSKEKAVVCHTCGKREEAPDTCPSCGGYRWRFGGFGIERVESEFLRLFPEVPLYRLDADSKKETQPALTMAAFGQNTPACLVCTSMALGYDMPKIATVGVLSADTLLNLPDYRSAERVYHLLSTLRELQTSPGEAGAFVVQTYNPQNLGIRAITDPEAFYEEALAERRVFGYPPYKRLFMARFFGRNESRVREAASVFAAEARLRTSSIDILGPTPNPKPKVRGEYRWQVALRGGDSKTVRALHREFTPDGGVRTVIDADPI